MTPRAVLITLAIALGLGSAILLDRRRMLREEIALMGTARAEAAEATGDARLGVDVNRVRFALEQARSQPAKGAEAHLALALTDGLLTLERGDIVFRTASVESDVLRGVHRIEKVEDERITLSGGMAVIPVTAAGSTPPPVGTIRVPRADFDAIRPNLRPGQSAFFF